LITITTDAKVKVSPRAKGVGADKASEEFLWRFDGAEISLPRRFAPDAGHLRYHNEHIFLRR
jgi:hypothetical protein